MKHKVSGNKKKILLIDVFNFLHRAYHALPKTFTDREGNPTNAVYGLTSMLINIFDSVSPDYVIAALDSEGATLRSKDFEQYKAHRKPMDDELRVQIEPAFEIIDAFGVTMHKLEGYEADDIIGTISSNFVNNPDIEVIIASNDRDLWQLVGDNVYYILPSNRGSKVEWLGINEVKKRLGFNPDLTSDYKGLRGDPSDNIPGIYGVGDVTATKLINEFGRLENLYDNLDQVKPESLRRKLEENREIAFVSRDLATIVTDVPFDFQLDCCTYSTFNKGEVKKALEKHNFKSLIKKLGFEVSGKTSKSSSGSGPVVNENQIGLF